MDGIGKPSVLEGAWRWASTAQYPSEPEKGTHSTEEEIWMIPAEGLAGTRPGHTQGEPIWALLEHPTATSGSRITY